MSHHSRDDLPPEIAHRLHRELEGMAGPTGNYPRGALGPDDDGEIQIAVAADKTTGLVIVHFGVATQWIAFTPDQATELADLIHQKGWQARGITLP